MLVAMTVTLILIFAVTQTFAVIGARIAEGRATIEMAGSLRAVANRLQADLDRLTCPVRPWIDSASGLGYFEYIEGPSSDNDWDANGTNEVDEDRNGNGTADIKETPPAPNVYTLYGDIDDILMFTARSPDAPYVGRILPAYNNGNSTIQSTVAEIVWFTQVQDQNGNGNWDPGERFTIHRRVLLIRPDLNVTNGYLCLAAGFSQNDNDLSVHLEVIGGQNVVVANSLANLTIRANRFAHVGAFPQPVSRAVVASSDAKVGAPTLLSSGYVKSGTYVGEDVVISDALAFDVQAFDAQAPLLPSTAGDALVPSDPGYFPPDTSTPPKRRIMTGAPGNAIGKGAFVDLGYGFMPVGGGAKNWSDFSNSPADATSLGRKSQLTIPTYCTWAFDYEHDGIDQDLVLGDPYGVDQGTNGVDDDGVNGVDDVGERETSPPYPVPLRGIQVKIRVYEPDTRQVRQATVVADFTPE
jgi:hypothetical protein